MSDDVKAKLAAAGWTYNEKSFWVETWSKTKTGSCGRILVFFGDGSHYRDVTWDKSGRDESGKSFNLVPLPAPEPERLTDDELQMAARRDGCWRQLEPMARELIEARRTIAQLEEENKSHIVNNTGLGQTIAEQAAEIEGHAKLLSLQHERLNPLRLMWQCEHGEPDTWPDLGDLAKWCDEKLDQQAAEIDRLTRERDAAMWIVRELRTTWKRNHLPDSSTMSEMDSLHVAACALIDPKSVHDIGDKPAPPPTCEHEYFAEICAKCGHRLYGENGMMDCPTCEPLRPATDPVCHCGETMDSHSVWGSCTSPKEMPPPTTETTVEGDRLTEGRLYSIAGSPNYSDDVKNAVRELIEARKTIDEYATEIEETGVERDFWKDKEERVANELSEVRCLRRKAAELASDLEQKVEAQRVEIVELKDSRDRWQHFLERAKYQLGQKSEAIDRLVEERDNIMDQIESRDRVAATMHNQIRELETTRRELEKLVFDLNNTGSKLRADVEELTRQKEAATYVCRTIRRAIEVPEVDHKTESIDWPVVCACLREIDRLYGDSPEMPPPTCEPLPPVNDAPEIEFVRYQFCPNVAYRVKSFERNNEGRVVKVDCGAVILTGEFQGFVGGVWRAI